MINRIKPTILIFPVILLLSHLCMSQGSVDKKANDVTGKYYLPPLTQPGTGALISAGLIYPLENPPTP